MWKLQELILTIFFAKIAWNQRNYFTLSYSIDSVSCFHEIFFNWQHCFWSLFHSQCGNYWNSRPHAFDKNFVKVTFLLNKILKSWFDEFFLVTVNFSFFHTVEMYISRREIGDLEIGNGGLRNREKFKKIPGFGYFQQKLNTRNFHQEIVKSIYRSTI